MKPTLSLPKGTPPTGMSYVLFKIRTDKGTLLEMSGMFEQGKLMQKLDSLIEAAQAEKGGGNG